MWRRFSMASQRLMRREQMLISGFPGMVQSHNTVPSSNVNAMRNQGAELLMPAS
jgi:hypothetical protein